MSDESENETPQNEDVQERTQGQEQPRYIDPNSGAAPQPGGFAQGPVQTEDDPAPRTLGDPEADPVIAHTRETQAAPAGEQPSDDSGTNAAEDGTTEEQEGEGKGGDAGDSQAGSSGDSEGGPEGASEDEGGQSQAGDSGGKDYSELLEKNADEVKSYMDEHPEEAEAVKAAEAQREKPRKGVLEH